MYITNTRLITSYNNHNILFSNSINTIKMAATIRIILSFLSLILLLKTRDINKSAIGIIVK
jgi:hypothetical protein